MTSEPSLALADSSLRKLLSRSSGVLSKESQAAVLHYLDHDEHEMAFEGLFLDLMAVDHWPEDFAWNDFLALAKQLRLDRHQNFQGEFWKRFLSFGAKHSPAKK